MEKKNIIESIKTKLNNDVLFSFILPKIEYQINNPDPKYGIISPMYSLMPCFFDYYNVDLLSSEQMIEADRIISIVDAAFGFGWKELSQKISNSQELRTNEIISDLKYYRSLLKVIAS